MVTRKKTFASEKTTVHSIVQADKKYTYAKLFYYHSKRSFNIIWLGRYLSPSLQSYIYYYVNLIICNVICAVTVYMST